MKATIYWFFLTLLIFSCSPENHPKTRSPRQLFPGLFADVQNAQVFADSKTFPDCIPRHDPAVILKRYEQERSVKGFSLKAFVTENFSLPESPPTPAIDPSKNITDHIRNLWAVLSHQPAPDEPNSSLIALPEPYVVPGGRFREIYYWDSYFTMLGLEESGRSDLIEQMVNNFAWLIRNYHFIPNGNRSYYLTRSQPPFFSLMVELLMRNKGSSADSVLEANRDALETEYRFWMDTPDKNSMASGHVVKLSDTLTLNRYYDKGDWPREEAYREDIRIANESGRPPEVVFRELRSAAESGWDFSSRWFADGKSLSSIRTTELIPVDLNALLLHLEQLLAKACRAGHSYNEAFAFDRAARRRTIAIEKFCWDERNSWYFDYDWKHRQFSDQWTLAAVVPLFLGVPDQGQADRMASVIETRFLKAGGLITTLVDTRQQWDAPNGWAPLQWMAVAGLNASNHKRLAAEITGRWSRLNRTVYKNTGKLMEKYNVMDTTLVAGGGEYPSQDGFGWTNGVLLKMLNRH